MAGVSEGVSLLKTRILQWRRGSKTARLRTTLSHPTEVLRSVHPILYIRLFILYIAVLLTPFAVIEENNRQSAVNPRTFNRLNSSRNGSQSTSISPDRP